ncbi:MAG: hypothetical protein V1859_02485 [archaeon]
MNRKANISIFSNRAMIVIVAFIVLIILGIIGTKNIDLTPITRNQDEISQELRSKTDTIIGSIDSQKNAIQMLNEKVTIMETNQIKDTTIKDIRTEIFSLKTQVEENNNQIQSISNRVSAVEENVKIIEPSYVQNIDTKDLRTFINIFNFRLILNFFIALSFSLVGIELVKIFGDFYSYSRNSKDYNIENYWQFRNQRKKLEIKIYNEMLKQEFHHHQHSQNEKQ